LVEPVADAIGQLNFEDFSNFGECALCFKEDFAGCLLVTLKDDDWKLAFRLGECTAFTAEQPFTLICKSLPHLWAITKFCLGNGLVAVASIVPQNGKGFHFAGEILILKFGESFV
jgi:hypothetical protein